MPPFCVSVRDEEAASFPGTRAAASPHPVPVLERDIDPAAGNLILDRMKTNEASCRAIGAPYGPLPAPSSVPPRRPMAYPLTGSYLGHYWRLWVPRQRRTEMTESGFGNCSRPPASTRSWNRGEDVSGPSSSLWAAQTVK